MWKRLACEAALAAVLCMAFLHSVRAEGASSDTFHIDALRVFDSTMNQLWDDVFAGSTVDVSPMKSVPVPEPGADRVIQGVAYKVFGNIDAARLWQLKVDMFAEAAETKSRDSPAAQLARSLLEQIRDTVEAMIAPAINASDIGLSPADRALLAAAATLPVFNATVVSEATDVSTWDVSNSFRRAMLNPQFRFDSAEAVPFLYAGKMVSRAEIAPFLRPDGNAGDSDCGHPRRHYQMTAKKLGARVMARGPEVLRAEGLNVYNVTRQLSGFEKLIFLCYLPSDNKALLVTRYTPLLPLRDFLEAQRHLGGKSPLTREWQRVLGIRIRQLVEISTELRIVFRTVRDNNALSTGVGFDVKTGFPVFTDLYHGEVLQHADEKDKSLGPKLAYVQLLQLIRQRGVSSLLQHGLGDMLSNLESDKEFMKWYDATERIVNQTAKRHKQAAATAAGAPDANPAGRVLAGPGERSPRNEL